MHQTLPPRSYGVKELASIYFPNIAPASASIRLKRWIRTPAALTTALAETNYRLTT